MNAHSTVSFNDLAESKEFAEFFAIVREFTGVLVALVDPAGGRSKQLFPQSALNPLCQLIQSRPAGLAACRETDRINCELAAKNKDGRHYLCHAGLIDMAVPIFVDGRHIATMNCGQILPAPPSEEGLLYLEARCQYLTIPTPLLRKAYFSSPYLAQAKMQKLLRLFTFFASYCCEVGFRFQQQQELASHPEITQAMQYLQRHFREVSSLEETASHVNLSPAYFSTLFKKVTGVPYSKYLNQLRIDEAKRLLQYTEISITEIAHQVGFNNLTHFDRVFRALENYPPSQLRQVEPKYDERSTR